MTDASDPNTFTPSYIPLHKRMSIVSWGDSCQVVNTITLSLNHGCPTYEVLSHIVYNFKQSLQHISPSCAIEPKGATTNVVIVIVIVLLVKEIKKV